MYKNETLINYLSVCLSVCLETMNALERAPANAIKQRYTAAINDINQLS